MQLCLSNVGHMVSGQSMVAATVLLFVLKCLVEWLLSKWELSASPGSIAHPNLACPHLSLARQAKVLLWASSASSQNEGVGLHDRQDSLDVFAYQTTRAQILYLASA